MEMVFRNAKLFLFIVALIHLPGLAQAASGLEMNEADQSATLMDLVVRDKFSMQLVSGVLYSPVLENGSRPDFNYFQTNLRFVWMLNPSIAIERMSLGGNFDFVFELTTSIIFNGPGNVITGVSGLLRYDFARHFEQFRFYAQGGMGVVYTNAYKDYSQSLIGQGIEFTPQLSLGAHYLINKNWSIDGEVMYHHISNANMDDRNAGVNALGGFVGVTYYFSSPAFFATTQ
jgi:opacity protein-like surface antigen